MHVSSQDVRYICLRRRWRHDEAQLLERTVEALCSEYNEYALPATTSEGQADDAPIGTEIDFSAAFLRFNAKVMAPGLDGVTGKTTKAVINEISKTF